MKGASGRGRNFVVENRELIQEIQSILGEEIKEIRKLQEQTNNEVKEIKKIMVVNKLSQLVDNYDKIAKIKQKKLEKDIKVKPKKEIEAKRGGVYLIRFDPLKKGKFKRVVKDTEIKDPHPAVVISNDIQNQKSSRITVVPLTHILKPFYESWEVYSNFNQQRGKIMCDQVKNIDKKRIIKYVGTLDPKTMKEVERKILEGLELIKAISSEQLLMELARRIKNKEID
ncbi:14415_t:CDS:2 [Cetraspora pellucida]|uniref:14415_t:CDS:1 n=1 Tax=Cetraspora pellucida TaxID=1433469 RepID=A0ACA9NVP0_9GLOM|nr:14415_t:CDS:2 [Cetraspora pellucida]